MGQNFEDNLITEKIINFSILNLEDSENIAWESINKNSWEFQLRVYCLVDHVFNPLKRKKYLAKSK